MLATALMSVLASGERTIDYSQCAGTSDYGWPRFTSEQAMRASPWADYLSEVYGSLPTFPFCTFDLWYMDNTTASFAALNLTLNDSLASHGNCIGCTWHEGDYKDGDFYDTDFGLVIYHSQVATVANDTWIEVKHVIFDTETSAMWFTRARGSGIWYNVGSTIVFSNGDNHQEAYDYFEGHGCEFPSPAEAAQLFVKCCKAPTNETQRGPPCANDPQRKLKCQMQAAAVKENRLAECAAAEGFESIQFTPEPNQPIVETMGHVGWIELLSTSLRGNYSCGTPAAGTSAGLRSGWAAAEPCDCVDRHEVYAATNCDGNKVAAGSSHPGAGPVVSRAAI